MTTRRLLATVTSVLMITSCSSTTSANLASERAVSSTSTTVQVATTIRWNRCSTADADCAIIQVPFDHDRPELGTFDLPVSRHRARDPKERIGVLFVNPGGPGGSGLWLAQDADAYFSSEIVDRFDIIGWDPRGTGGARPSLDCNDDMDAYFALDPSPDDADERKVLIDAARDFVASCTENSGSILPYVGTTASARDIDLMRRLLGEETVSYFGFSYGSELGSTWVTLFPDTVRAAVFDAAADPDLDVMEWLAFQATGFERALEAFLDECDDLGCRFVSPGETARDSFDRIMEAIDSAPLVVEGRAPVGQGVAQVAVYASLYSSSGWDSLDLALADADAGFGDRLVTLFDGYFGGYRDGHPDDSIDSYVAITCLDRTRDFDVDAAFAAMDDVLDVSPRIGPSVLQETLLCSLWPGEPSPPPDVEWTRDLPILVVGSTGDSATPLEGTRRMRDALGHASLIVVDSFEHTSYGLDDCATAAVDEYLVDPYSVPSELNC